MICIVYIVYTIHISYIVYILHYYIYVIYFIYNILYRKYVYIKKINVITYIMKRGVSMLTSIGYHTFAISMNLMQEEADLILLILDASRYLEQEDREILNFIKDKKTIILLNKIDLEQKITKEMLIQYRVEPDEA